MSNALPTDYQSFIHISRYARWLDKEGRRETPDETFNRYLDFFEETLEEKNGYKLPSTLRSELYDAMFSLQVMPSMRALMTAGPALRRCNVGGFNCSYLPIDNIRCFDELLYILMCGCGVGFSVERQFVNMLPAVNEHFEHSSTTIVVEDSKSGWARALRELISMLYAGQIPKHDTSKLRPAGARLKTFGGRSSGPGPLIELFEFVIRKFVNAAGRKLSSLEVHDIVCKIGEIVVVGGVRRSALISLSNLSDDRLRLAKSGQWWNDEPQRALANNSYALTEKPEMGIFINEWKSLYESRSGERGIYSRYGADKHVLASGRRETGHDWGTNPCGEIILRPFEFCNLSEAVIRSTDGVNDLKEKVRLAAILGTFQSTLTNFKYLRKIWRDNCNEERLLGVSLTGIMDSDLTNTRADQEQLKELLTELRKTVIDTNKKFADKLKINQSTATTTVKPSGTVSQLVDSASGIHSRHDPYYIRSVRGDNKDPLTIFLRDSGIPHEPCVMKPDHTTVFFFPVKAPPTSVFRSDLDALTHLEHWLIYRDYWAEHTVSVTISVKEEEWMRVGSWVYDHIDELTGISFLPHTDHVYKQAPYETVSKEKYEEMLARMPEKIDWDALSQYEAEDNTSGSQELACAAGGCEIADI